MLKKSKRKNRQEIYIAVLHHPVYGRKRKVITTSIANLDFHDIARVAKTYDIKKVYFVTPIENQKQLGQTIIDHWTQKEGKTYNPKRKEAFSILEIKDSLKDVILNINNQKLVTIGTSARKTKRKFFNYPELKALSSKNPVLLIFGTGWGLTDRVLTKLDHILEPIYGVAKYNHLPVRAAVAIVLDRMLDARG